jgi:hypothetical protein
MSEEDARRFLTRNTYFFKLKCYENNYGRIDASPTYVYDRLDFGHLVELSQIDFCLSRLLWGMCSGIEHAIKVDFNRMLMDATDPGIGDKCMAACPGNSRPEEHDNPYTNDLRSTFGPDFSIWHLWELSSFQQQIDLYNAAYKMMKGLPNPWRHILFTVRKTRNAVSHGNCLMADLHRQAPSLANHQRSDLEITGKAMEMCGRKLKTGSRPSTFQKTLDSLIVNNFAAVLLSHLHYVDSPGKLRHRQQDMKTFIERVERHREEYFGDQGASSPRNQLINQTLTAFVTLANGYVEKSEEKIVTQLS